MNVLRKLLLFSLEDTFDIDSIINSILSNKSEMKLKNNNFYLPFCFCFISHLYIVINGLINHLNKENSIDITDTTIVNVCCYFCIFIVIISLDPYYIHEGLFHL